jgi:leucine efflux protein
MLGIADFPTLVITTFVFLALPGPGTLALLNATARGGWRAGAAATGGLMAADQLLLWLAVGGVAAALLVRPALLSLLQTAGAAYLIWVGVTLIFERIGGTAPIRRDHGHHARQAFLITLLNPKALIFYIAFVPLFVDPARHRGVLTFAAIALTVALITAAYCLTLCAVAGRLSVWFQQRPAAGLWLKRGAGLALVGFGVRMLL